MVVNEGAGQTLASTLTTTGAPVGKPLRGQEVARFPGATVYQVLPAPT